MVTIRVATLWIVALSSAATQADLTVSCEDLQARYFVDVVKIVSWKELHSAFQCVRSGEDDGVVAGAFSDRVAWLLSHQWPQLRELSDIASQDPSFRIFVLRHVDATMTDGDLATIRANAKSHCPATESSLCTAIAEAANQANQSSP